MAREEIVREVRSILMFAPMSRDRDEVQELTQLVKRESERAYERGRSISVHVANNVAGDAGNPNEPRPEIDGEVSAIVYNFNLLLSERVERLTKIVEREFALGVSVGRGLEQSARGDTIPMPTDWNTYPNDGVSE